MNLPIDMVVVAPTGQLWFIHAAEAGHALDAGQAAAVTAVAARKGASADGVLAAAVRATYRWWQLDEDDRRFRPRHDFGDLLVHTQVHVDGHFQPGKTGVLGKVISATGS